MRNVIKMLLIVYLIFLSVFLIVEFSPLEFTVKSIKTIFYEYTLFGLPIFGLTLGLFIIRKKYWNIVAGIGLGIAGIFVLNSIAFSFMFWHGHSIWETKEVIAINKKNEKILIVEQWINSGALGYSKGIHKTRPITSFLSWNEDYYGKTLDTNWKILVNRKLEI